MSSAPPQADENGPVVVHYFIDEAGDPVLFGRRKVIVGSASSRYFILGKLEVGDPAAVAQALEELRKQLLADPYFNSVPSMKPEEGKTAVIFHAKDDLAEVRDRVFHLLAAHDLRFSAVVRDKLCLVEQVRARNQAEPHYRYKGEDRFWRFVWPKVRVVHDLDDTRENSFGTIYTPQKPLTLDVRAKKQPVDIGFDQGGSPSDHTA